MSKQQRAWREGRALPVSHPAPPGTVIQSSGLVSLGPPHPLRQCSFSRVEVGGGMQLSRWVMALLTVNSLGPSHGPFLQSSFWVWELARISVTSLQFVWPAENPADPLRFRQKSTTSILWVEAGGVVHSHVASAELRNPGLSLLATAGYSSHGCPGPSGHLTHGCRGWLLIATADEIHSFCKLVSCVCDIVSHNC